MSGRISIRFVDFAVFLLEFDRVRCGSFGLFLVRNWCGSQLVIDPTAPVLADGASAIRREVDLKEAATDLRGCGTRYRVR
jgi:hypothetical protein